MRRTLVNYRMGFHIGLNISVCPYINAPTFIDDCLRISGFEGKAVETDGDHGAGPLLSTGRLWTQYDLHSRGFSIAGQPAIPGFPVATSWFHLYPKSIRVLSAG